MLRLYLLCLAFFVDGLGGWACESFDCFVVMVPGIGCYLGLIDGGYGVIEEIKTPAVAGALMSRLRIHEAQNL